MTAPVLGTERPPLYSTAGHDLPLITRWIDHLIQQFGYRPEYLDRLDLKAMQFRAELWQSWERRLPKIGTDQERHERSVDQGNAAATYDTGRYGQSGGV